MYRLLIVGTTFNNHLIRLIRNLKKYNDKASIDFVCLEKKEAPEEMLSFVDNVYKISICNKRTNIFRPIVNIISIRKFFKNLSKTKRYDVINIHFPIYEYTFSLDILHRLTKRILLTPWGSDVYRVSNLKRRLLTPLYRKSDNVCCIGNRFDRDLKQIFKLPDEKFVFLSMASESIDYLFDKKDDINTETAKEFWGIDNSYVITCGYNGSTGQNHVSIIEAIHTIKGQLPNNLLLLFPYTYAGTVAYKESLQTLMNQYDIHFKFITHYLTLEELLYLRMASDMFIHVQKTDANSSSLKEYILCGKKVINGSWLQYDDLNEYEPKPYFEIDSLEHLGDFIVKVYNSPSIITNKKTIENILQIGYKYCTPRWDQYYRRNSKGDNN